ncbi:MAG: selenocysteine-specific translation elongation factor [Phycisphaerae bacterium]
MTAPPLVVGTAGHIDHGKSALVRALTGVDPDRLPEEKSRGMTIDLGFAHTQVRDRDLYFVDVPGHERFIRNMVAGATGIDVALLVVAADDAIMPQTREHVDILQVLGVRDIVVAISKTDLADDDWCDAVAEEVAALLDAQGFAPRAIVRTSAKNGTGVDAVRETLAAIESPAAHPARKWFRLPIDRVFTVPGRGTIVTGTVLHGTVNIGDALQLWPSGRSVRVRDLQTHNDATTSAAGRLRLAVNLPGIATEEVQRGDELATCGFLAPVYSCAVVLSRLRRLGKRNTRRVRTRLHLGTSDVLAEICLEEAANEPRELSDVLATLKTAQPITPAYGQGFALRDESGQITLGGGRIIRPAPCSPRTLARCPAKLRQLTAEDARVRLEASIFLDIWCVSPPERLAAVVGVPDTAEVKRLLQSLIDKQRVIPLASGNERAFIHVDQFKELAAHVVRQLENAQAANPRQLGIARPELLSWVPASCPLALRDAFAAELLERGHLRERGNRVVVAGAVGKLSPADQLLFDQIVEEIAQGDLQPPTLSSLSCRTPGNHRRCDELVKLAEDQGELVRLTENLFLHSDAWARAQEIVVAHLVERGAMTVSDMRDAIQSSRKVVVPLVEKFDALGLTKRDGDLRSLNRKPDNPASAD